MPRYSFTDPTTGKRYSLRFEREPTPEEFNEAVDDILNKTKDPAWTVGGAVEATARGAGEVGRRKLGEWGWGLLGAWERKAAEMDRYWGWASEESIRERLELADYADDLAREVGREAGIMQERLTGDLPQHQFAAGVGAAIPSLAPTFATLPVGGLLKAGRAGQVLLGGLVSGGVSGAAELQRQRMHRLKDFEKKYGHLGRDEIELMALMDSTLPALGAAAITAGVTTAAGGLGMRLGIGGGPEALGVRGGGTGKLADWMSRGGWSGVAAKSAGGQAILEGVEEGIDEALQSYAVRRLTTNPELTWSDAIDAGVEAMKIGAVLGGFTGPLGSRKVAKEANDARKSAAMLAEIRGEVQKQEAASARERLRIVQPHADETALEIKLREELMAKPIETPTEMIKRKTQETLAAQQPAADPRGAAWVKSVMDRAAAASLAEGTVAGARPQVAEEFRESALPVRPPESPEAEIEKVAREESKESDVFDKGDIKVSPLRTSNQIFPIGKPARSKKAAREAAAVQPAEFTGQEAVVRAGEPVSRPEPVSREADLGKLYPGSRGTQITQGLTAREQAALKREERGRLPSSKEVKARKKAWKGLKGELEKIQKHREEKKTGKGKVYGGLAAIEGVTDAMINTGLDAGIAAAEVSNSATTVMRASLDAMKASNPKVFATLDTEELKAAMAGEIADAMPSSRRVGSVGVFDGSDGWLFPDGKHLKVASEGHDAGIVRWAKKNKGNPLAKRLLKDVFIGQQSKMALVPLATLRATGITRIAGVVSDWVNDVYADGPLNYRQKRELRDWGIENDITILHEPPTSLPQSRLIRIHEGSGKPRDAKPFKASIKKLEKLQATLRGYIKKTRGRMNSNPIPMLTASAADAALSVAISALNAGATIKAAIDKAYANLDIKGVSEARFRDYMVARMLAALDVAAGGADLNKSVAAATSTDTVDMPAEIRKKQREIMDAADAGLIPTEMATQEALSSVKNMKDWLWALAVGRSEDTVTELGFKLLGNRINYQQFLRQRLASMFTSMVFDREGGWNSSKKWREMWHTMPTEERKAAKEEVKEFRKEMHISQYEGGIKPDIDRLSPLARNLYDGIDEAWVAMGKYAAAHPVYVIDEKGNVEKGKYEIGKGGSPMIMLPVELNALNNLNQHSLVDEFVQSLIGRVGKTTPDVKDLNSLIHWRDQSRISEHYKTKDGKREKETPSQMYSQLEKKRRNPLHSSMLDFTVDSFHQNIENWAKRMSEIEAYGQKISPEYNGQDIFDITQELLDKKHGMGESSASKYLTAIKNSVYGINSPMGVNVKKTGALLESTASLTMLTGIANAMRNATGALEIQAGAFYAGNPAAVKKALSMKNIRSLQEAGFDAAHLRSWGVLKQDMVDLMTGYESTDSAVLGAVKRIDRLLAKTRRAQKVALSATFFKGTEFGVRWLSAVTAHVLVTDAIEANRVGDNPKLVDEFESFAGDMKNVNVKKLLEGDKKAAEDFIVRFVTDTQGGYTPNQLPWWITTPMGRFMGKFMPYGIMMNQFHQKNLRRRLERRKARYGKVAGYPMTAGDLLKMAVLFGLGGEAFTWLLQQIFGRERGRDIATGKEIFAGDEKPISRRAGMLYDRWYDSVLYTGALGAVMEGVENVQALAGQDTRSKDLLDPAGLAILKNTAHLVQDIRSQGALDLEIVDKYVEKQVSLWRYGKRALYQGANTVGIDWDNAVRFQKQRDYYILRNSAKRFADEKGIDVVTLFSDGRFKPSPYGRYYNSVKDDLFVGNPEDALKGAVKFAEESGVERDKSWSRMANSITRSQPLKVGSYTSTEVQKEYMNWAKNNLPHDDYVRIQNVQAVYTDTAEKAGLISGGDPRVKANTKRMMTLERPKTGRPRRRRSSSTDLNRQEMKSIFGY